MASIRITIKIIIVTTIYYICQWLNVGNNNNKYNWKNNIKIMCINNLY